MSDLISRSEYKSKLVKALDVLNKEYREALLNEDNDLILAIQNKLSAYTGEHYGFFNQLLGEMIKLSNLIKWESSPKSTIESTFILLCQKG